MLCIKCNVFYCVKSGKEFIDEKETGFDSG